VPIVVFFVFVAVVGVCILALGYVLAPLDEQTESRRCRMPYRMYHRRIVRRQRVRCKLEG
jgi:hypothetical protein